MFKKHPVAAFKYNIASPLSVDLQKSDISDTIFKPNNTIKHLLILTFDLQYNPTYPKKKKPLSTKQIEIGIDLSKNFVIFR